MANELWQGRNVLVVIIVVIEKTDDVRMVEFVMHVNLLFGVFIDLNGWFLEIVPF